ncbi:hypothetical protein COCOBI_13-2200 [Coccomyxa sp. Obi]|nr:hypothetical protein COCOBI_13-2200 [Coccomyxa sp. Obi]
MKHFEEHSSNEEDDNPSTEEGGITKKNQEHATDQVKEDHDTSETRDEGSPRGPYDVHAGSVDTSPIKSQGSDTVKQHAGSADSSPIKSQGSDTVMDKLKDLSYADVKIDEEYDDDEGDDFDLEDFQRYTAQSEHNKKALEKIYTIVDPVYESHQEDAGASNEMPTEWVVGEWNGYKYEVPMEYHRTVEAMSFHELGRHNKAMKQRIEDRMERTTKMVNLLEKIRTLVS